MTREMLYHRTLICILAVVTVAHGRDSAYYDECGVTSAAIRNTLSHVCDARPLLGVAFGRKIVRCDEISSRNGTSVKPRVKLTSAHRNHLYTLFMVDPDAPGHSLKKLKFWLHWAVTDIKGRYLQVGLTLGRDLMKYEGPSPPSGIHRYQIIVFKSEPGFQLDRDTRRRFSLKDIDKLCSIAGVFQFRVPSNK